MPSSRYRTVFELKSIDSNREMLDLVVEFQVDPRLREISVRSVSSYIDIKDLKRLVTYFEQHIASLKENSNSKSSVFIEYGLSFQIQASEGEIRSESEGEFSLQVMVNIGQPAKGYPRTYIGGESVVTLENIQSFTSSVNELLIELSNNF